MINKKIEKIFIIAGEASGDLHGSNLVKELRLLNPNLVIKGWGGDFMKKAGVDILKEYKDLAFMGFTEVAKNLSTILKNFKICKRQISEFNPNAIIFVDFAGFNLPMSKWAKENNYRSIFYISPQIWAWKEKRIHSIKKYIDQMIVILPFEKEFYKKWDYNVQYVGHPLIQVINDFKDNHISIKKEKKIIALLPGSRKQEIKAKLPLMLKMANHFTDYQFVVAKAPGIDDVFYKSFLENYTNVNAQSESTYNILSNAYAALVTSGTATLETALFKVPEIICYKSNKISYLIAKKIIKIKYIGLVNLIMNKLVVTELIQDDFNEMKLKDELSKILNIKNREAILKNYEELETLLKQGGDASANAAALILYNN